MNKKFRFGNVRNRWLVFLVFRWPIILFITAQGKALRILVGLPPHAPHERLSRAFSVFSLISSDQVDVDPDADRVGERPTSHNGSEKQAEAKPELPLWITHMGWGRADPIKRWNASGGPEIDTGLQINRKYEDPRVAPSVSSGTYHLSG